MRFPQATTRVRTSAIATLAVCAAGAVPGSAAAVSGSSLSGDAGAAQYLTPSPPPPLSDVLSDTDEGNPDLPDSPGETLPGSSGDPGETLGAGEGGGQVPVAAIAADVDSGNSLPFTGLAAIPLLAAGALLAAGGVALRRRASRSPAA